MYKIIEVSWWSDKTNDVAFGDALVEYTRYNEDGVIVNDITHVFLPEGVPVDQQAQAKKEAANDFGEML